MLYIIEPKQKLCCYDDISVSDGDGHGLDIDHCVEEAAIYLSAVTMEISLLAL